MAALRFVALLCLSVTALSHMQVALAAEEEFKSNVEKSLQMAESEIITRMKALYVIIDTNKDGKVTKDELMAWVTLVKNADQTKQAEMEFKSLDTNEDGKVSMEEMKAAFGAAGDEEGTHDVEVRLKLVDKDGDGFLSLEEVSTLMNPAKEPALLELEIDEVLKTQDKDGDGAIDLKEFFGSDTLTESEKSEYEAEFKMYDTDGDNVVSREEIRAVIVSSSGDGESAVNAFFTDLKSEAFSEADVLADLQKYAVSVLTENGELLRFPDDYGHLELPFSGGSDGADVSEDLGEDDDRDEL